MKYQEIKDLATADLLLKLKEEQQRYQKLKFGHAVTPLENSQVIKTSRRLIARYKTELSARQQQPITAN